MKFTLCVPYLGFLPLSVIRPVTSRSIMSSVSMKPDVILFVSLVLSAGTDVLLYLGGFASWLCVVSIKYAHESVVRLVCSLLCMASPNLGHPRGVV